jgi:hypothetical protein
MGLDIYLYRYENFDETSRKENEYERFSEKLWEEAGEYDALNDDQKDAIRQKCGAFAISLGLSFHGADDENKKKIEIDSTKYPGHYFKVGYFRSSYNASGIERILKNMNLPSLHWVFDREDSEEYCFTPDWKIAKERIQLLKEQFGDQDPYRVAHVSQNIFKESLITSEAQALDVLKKELEKKNGQSNGFGNYSNSEGEFYLDDPLEVVAMIPGKYKLFNEMDCVYIITKSDNSWYENALEIVEETIDWVLSQPDQEKYRIHWSG